VGIFSRTVPDAQVVTEVGRTMDLAEQLDQARSDLELMVEESLADVELALEDRVWRLLSLQADRQFTRTGLRQAAKLARTMAIVNPLIRRGLSLRTAYVWGGGVQITARATGDNEDNAEEQDVNAVVQAWLDDPATRKVLTSAAARETNERTLGTDGIFAVALFTKPLTGAVRPVHVPSDELEERITNPEDASETWYWKRIWVETSVGPDGVRTSETRTTYYPDIDYRPRGLRLQRIGGSAVMWDAPIAVLNVNGLAGWDFGIGDAFAALPWARGYKEFLEDWALYMKALARFVWRTTAKTKEKAKTNAAGTRDAARPTVDSRQKVGGVANLGPDQTLEAIPKTGATIDSESAKPLAGMVASAMDVPLTMLLADPGQTGARAVAETLDRPTELMAGQRRAVWADFHRQLLDYVIDQAVIASRGPLLGKVERDVWDREVVTLAGDTARTIEIVWPDLTETDPKTLLEALAAADGMDLLPDLVMVRLVLQALNVRDVDEIIEKYTQDGQWVRPDVSAGDVAVRRHRQGDDPADPADPPAEED
jgi:hypothetical protein